MSLLECFGKRTKRNKEHIVPPPSRETVDRSAALAREGINPDASSPPPPLPHRPLEAALSTKRVDNNYEPHADKIPISQTSQTTPSSHRKTNVPLAHQLSSEMLSTRVPIESPKMKRQEPLGEESGEVYLDPQTSATPDTKGSLPPDNVRVAPIPGRKKPIASISEEKRTDILNDYFQHDDSIKRSSVSPKHRPNRRDSFPDYTNMADVAEILSPDMGKKSTSPRHSTSAKDSELSKSLRRAPRPMPRIAGVENERNSGKASLSNSDSDDAAFDYENIPNVLDGIPKSPTIEDVSPITPKPKPRPRTEQKNSQNNAADGTISSSLMQQPIPSPKLGRVSPLQRDNAKEGYVTEVSYVSPSDPLVTRSKPTTPTPSPPGTLPKTPQSQTLGVNLSAPVPKHPADVHVGLQAHDKKKGYLPMDHSPRTKAHMDQMNETAHPPPTNHYDLNVMIPVGNVNDVHVPGYITVLGEPTKPTVTGAYYNISQKSDYINATLDKPPVKSRHHTTQGALSESPYFN